MAGLTVLEEKLAEVIGLAMAAQGTTEKVVGLTDDDELTEKLEQMHEEARETEERGTQLADELNGKKTAVLDKARETKGEAAEMMSTYLGDDADALDGFEFPTMAEAGEVGHWSVLRKLNEQAGEQRLQELIEGALPIQERHFDDVKAGSSSLRDRRIRPRPPSRQPPGSSFTPAPPSRREPWAGGPRRVGRQSARTRRGDQTVRRWLGGRIHGRQVACAPERRGSRDQLIVSSREVRGDLAVGELLEIARLRRVSRVQHAARARDELGVPGGDDLCLGSGEAVGERRHDEVGGEDGFRLPGSSSGAPAQEATRVLISPAVSPGARSSAASPHGRGALPSGLAASRTRRSGRSAAW